MARFKACFCNLMWCCNATLIQLQGFESQDFRTCVFTVSVCVCVCVCVCGAGGACFLVERKLVFVIGIEVQDYG
jgi:hypothetical protein